MTPILRCEAFFRRARETVYWPCMNAEIADYTQKCDVCMSFQSTPTKEPPICDESPSRAWEKVANDFFTLLEKNYPCPAQKTTSGYFEVDQLHRKTGTVIIKKLKRFFATHGIPNELLSDKGPPFYSAEFENFLRSSGTEDVTSSPGYPQSNGRVENAVKTAKSLIKTAKASGIDRLNSAKLILLREN